MILDANLIHCLLFTVHCSLFTVHCLLFRYRWFIYVKLSDYPLRLISWLDLWQNVPKLGLNGVNK